MRHFTGRDARGIRLPVRSTCRALLPEAHCASLLSMALTDSHGIAAVIRACLVST